MAGPRGGQRQGPRRAGRRRLRGRQAAVLRQGRVRVHRRDPQAAPRPPRAARAAATRRSTRRRPRTTVAAGAATSSDVAGSGPSSSSAPSSAAGPATASSARRRTRASNRTATPGRHPRERGRRRPRRSARPRPRPPHPTDEPAGLTAMPRPRRTRRKARPPTHATSRRARHRAELAALDALGKEGIWQVGGHELKLTNLDKPLFEGRGTGDDAADHEARPDPLLRPDRAGRCCRTSPTGRSTSSASRTAPAPPASGRRTSPRPRRNGSPAGTRPASTAARTETPTTTSSPTTSRAVLARQPGQLRDPRLDRQAARAVATDLRLHRHRPRRRRPPGTRRSSSPGSTAPRSSTSASAATQDDRQARHPDLDPDRPAPYDFSDTSAWVEKRQPGRRRRPSRTSSPGSGRRRRRKGRARLDYTQNASIKTLVAPYSVRPAAGAPVSTPIAWDELDDPDLRPDRWTVRDIIERVAAVGDLFAAAQTDAQELPSV